MGDLLVLYVVIWIVDVPIGYIVDPKIVIKIYNFSILHKNMYVLKYSILNSFSQNPAISTFF